MKNKVMKYAINLTGANTNGVKDRIVTPPPASDKKPKLKSRNSKAFAYFLMYLLIFFFHGIHHKNNRMNQCQN